ncbi:unnamed protein product [Strongylus vulgaris]|uniref:Prp31 C-terminal domain-containing protein n=1 Tax=Strongylus vulgaris TaxID=40348 RepID=A0A3P7IS26_STRVU|nr:unnamed protein product [Strongylus vulgaris]
MEKLLEPPPVKASKALPKPLDKASKKRGGRRVRKMKERMGMTDLRKSANRMNFGELAEDVLQDHIGFDLGQVKTGNIAGGRIRAGVVDNKTRVKMSQKMQRQMERQRALGGVTSIRSKVSILIQTKVDISNRCSVQNSHSSIFKSKTLIQTAGTASSVTFTPVQGLEIINPTALEKTSTSSSTYFSSSASFVKVKTGNIAGGRIRAGVVDNKTRVKMSQKMQRQMERQRALGGVTSIRSKVSILIQTMVDISNRCSVQNSHSSIFKSKTLIQTAGTASSVTFTPVQGLEIINPTALEKTSTSSSTYFSSSASFVKVATPASTK